MGKMNKYIEKRKNKKIRKISEKEQFISL